MSVLAVPGSIEFTKAVIDARSARHDFLPSEILKDLSWDILLTLYHRELLDKRTSVSAAISTSRGAGTTGLRHIGRLVELGMVELTDDRTDARRSWARLSPTGCDAMTRYFASLAAVGWAHDRSLREMTLSTDYLLAMLSARLRTRP